MRDKISVFLKNNFLFFYNNAINFRDYLDIKRQQIIPYRYNPKKYENTFLINDYNDQEESTPLKKIIYCFWTGDNPMSENRRRGLDSLKAKSRIDVKLITPDNLNEYILPGYPIHEAYQYLSFIHKADYLRCYFMHHYGGGYADIKPYNHSWETAFNNLEKQANKYIIGYTEIRKLALADVGGDLIIDMRRYYTKIIGNCAYLCRARTPFTHEWYNELHKRLDILLPKLKTYNYDPTDYKGRNPDYPVRFLSILGEIFHPLCLKHHDKILHDNHLLPELTNYQ